MATDLTTMKKSHTLCLFTAPQPPDATNAMDRWTNCPWRILEWDLSTLRGGLPAIDRKKNERNTCEIQPAICGIHSAICGETTKPFSTEWLRHWLVYSDHQYIWVAKSWQTIDEKHMQEEKKIHAGSTLDPRTDKNRWFARTVDPKTPDSRVADIPSGWYIKKYAMFFQNDGTLGIKLIVPQVEISILDFTSFPFFGSLLPAFGFRGGTLCSSTV